MGLRAPLVSKLQTADVRLRREHLYQLLRRVCLWTATVGPGLMMLRHQNQGDRGPMPWVGAPWTVRVSGLEFMDPLAAAATVVTGAGSAAVLWGVIPTLVLVAWLGRFFCGWLCPYALLVGASNALRALLARLGFPQRDLALPDALGFFVLGVLLLVGALTGTVLAPLVYPPAIFHKEVYRVIFQSSLGGGAVLLMVFLIFDVTVARAGFCRYLCPGGAMFRLLGARSPVRVLRDANNCTHCTACDVVCNFLQSPMEDLHDAGCERCGKCVASCPTGALSMTHGQARLQVWRTGEAPCALRR